MGNIRSYLLLLALEVEDGGIAGVPSQLAQPSATAGEVQLVLRDVEGEVSQAGILPALCKGPLPLLLEEEGGGGGGRGEEGEGRR